MVLGRAYNRPFIQVLLMLSLIILGSISVLVYNSVFTCKTDEEIEDHQWAWFGLTYFGSNLMNYLLYAWLYQWHKVYLQKNQEAELMILLE